MYIKFLFMNIDIEKFGLLTLELILCLLKPGNSSQRCSMALL